MGLNYQQLVSPVDFCIFGGSYTSSNTTLTLGDYPVTGYKINSQQSIKHSAYNIKCSSYTTVAYIYLNFQIFISSTSVTTLYFRVGSGLTTFTSTFTGITTGSAIKFNNVLVKIDNGSYVSHTGNITKIA